MQPDRLIDMRDLCRLIAADEPTVETLSRKDKTFPRPVPLGKNLFAFSCRRGISVSGVFSVLAGSCPLTS